MSVDRSWKEWPVPQAGDLFVFPHSISVFFPAYNDAPSLPALIARTFEVLEGHARDYEVIVVNDGSTDDTGEVLEELRQRYSPYLRVITHRKNKGYGGALRSGFENATKEYVFYTDGDGQYDPAELLNLMSQVTGDVALVNGYKTLRHDPWYRTAIGFLYNRFARFLFQIRLRDIDCDFRLVRRRELEQIQLSSTSGTVCVELVRKLELVSPKVVETPVSHYPRVHGRSQFFRLRSLAVTFFQLCRLFIQLVLLQGVRRWLASAPMPPGESKAAEPEDSSTAREPANPPPKWNVALGVMGLVAVLAYVAYFRALKLPFIADDYLQILLGRDYGPMSNWSNLILDPLYRCRATSIVITYWTERLFGLEVAAYNYSSFLLHVFNSWLVFALGAWRVVGWRVSAVAALFFAFSQQHQEAVIWYAALPELLVFFFSLLTFLAWVLWIQSPSRSVAPYAASLLLFVLALFSKESAVVVIPLMGLAVLIQDRGRIRRLKWLIPFFFLAAFYFVSAYLHRDNHLHFNDGTFSLKTLFPLVILRSSFRLLWVWGFISLAALAVWRAREYGRVLGVAAAWIVFTLLPYSFLAYMPFVPSRHTYFASVGLSMIVAAGFLAFQQRAPKHRLAIALVALTVVGQNVGYLWTRKHQQYVERAAPTERLLQFASQHREVVNVECFPYPPVLVDLTLKVGLEGRVRPGFVTQRSTGIRDRNTLNLCETP